MSTDPNATPAVPGPAGHGRRFKRRTLQLPDGGSLVLNADGSIAQLGADGSQVGAWSPADPDWARHAIRFGLFPQDATVPPTGRSVTGMRPPRR